MRSVTFYFAGGWSGEMCGPEYELGVRNKLCSYAYKKQFSSWIENTKGAPGKMLLDSGAFTAWNTGTIIDVNEYIKWAKECVHIAKENNKDLRVVNLDVIPGRVGDTTGLLSSTNPEAKNIINEAARQGYENLQRFLDVDITPIHVFHQGESYDWLHKMIELTDYIGISPANDVSTSSKSKWMDDVYIHLDEIGAHDVKTHGFAVWIAEVVKKYPWTSVDAATWRLLPSFGGIMYPHGGFSNPDLEKGVINLTVSNESPVHKQVDGKAFKHQVFEWLKRDGYKIEQKLTKIRLPHLDNQDDTSHSSFDFEDGVSNIHTDKKGKVWGDIMMDSASGLQHWEPRTKICVKTFLLLEKWINEQKPSIKFNSGLKPIINFLGEI